MTSSAPEPAGRAGDLAFERHGAGRPFLWGHGLMASRAAEDSSGPIRWPGVDLPGIELIRWDARGHGDSPAATQPSDCHWSTLADDALALADRLDIGTFTAGGASMGAATALWVAAKAPDRVERLVLAIPPTAWTNRGRSRLLYRAGSVIAGAVPVDRLQRRSPVLRGASESDLPSPGVVESLSIPTLVLAWRADPVHPVSTAERIVDLLPAAELHVTSRPLDTTGWVDRLTDFLSY